MRSRGGPAAALGGLRDLTQAAYADPPRCVQASLGVISPLCRPAPPRARYGVALLRGRLLRRGARRGGGIRGPAIAGDPTALGVLSVGDDCDAFDVGELSFARPVGIPSQAPGGEAAGGVPAAVPEAGVAPDRCVRGDRLGEAAARFAADVALRGACQQSDVAGRRPAALSASIARRAASSLRYVLLSVVMRFVSFGIAVWRMRSCTCAALAAR